MLKKIALSLLLFFVIATATHQDVRAEEQMSMAEMQAQLMQLTRQVQELSGKVQKQDQMIAAQAQTIQNQAGQITEQARALSYIETAAGNDAAEKAYTEIHAASSAAPASTDNPDNGIKITMNPMPKIESADGRYSFQPFGRAHVDVTYFDDDAKDHPSNANIRRARIGFKGKLGEDMDYVAEVDFTGEDVSVKTTTLTYTGWDPADLKIGHFNPRLGFDINTSSNYIQFIERSTANNAFARGEHIGAGFFSGGDNWSLAGGVFNEDTGNNDTSDDEDISADLRGTRSFRGSNGNLLHLGLGGSYRKPTGTVKFAVKSTGIGDNLVDTGNISAVDDVIVGGLEAGAVRGPLSLKGEYLRANVDRKTGKTANFDGYYAQASYFLTGETRPYTDNTGYFSRIRPLNPFNPKGTGAGAWELAVRYEHLDLNDSSAGITGGEMDNYTLGVNWYLTDHIRMMANVIAVDTDENAVTANDDPNIFNFRTQWDF